MSLSHAPPVLNPILKKLIGKETASGQVMKGQGGGPKNFESEPTAPKGRQFEIVKKPKQRVDDDFPEEEDGNLLLSHFQTRLVMFYCMCEFDAWLNFASLI